MSAAPETDQMSCENGFEIEAQRRSWLRLEHETEPKWMRQLRCILQRMFLLDAFAKQEKPLGVENLRGLDVHMASKTSRFSLLGWEDEV